MNEISLKVNGMHCAGCENRVKNALSDVDNVKSVEADSKTGVVKVSYKEKIEISKIEEVIEDLGFEVVKED